MSSTEGTDVLHSILFTIGVTGGTFLLCSILRLLTIFVSESASIEHVEQEPNDGKSEANV